MNILSDNAAALAQKNASLKAEVNRKSKEISALRKENERLQSQVARLALGNDMDLLGSSDRRGANHNVQLNQHREVHSTAISNETFPRSYVQRVPVAMQHPPRPSVVPKPRVIHESTLDQSTVSRKRERSKLYERPLLPKPKIPVPTRTNRRTYQRPPRIGGGSVNIPQFSSTSRLSEMPVTGLDTSNVWALSKFAHVPSRWQSRSNFKSNRNSRTIGSWQARVSTVPRPTATPEQLERLRKRSRVGNNPLTSRR